MPLLPLLVALVLAAPLPAPFLAVPTTPLAAMAAEKGGDQAASGRGGERAADRGAKTAACRFAKDGDRWTLTADCVSKKTIELPAGVRLDGKGRTISLAGPRGGFDGGALVARGGNVQIRDLAIDGAGLAKLCDQWDDRGQPIAALRLADASGTIEGLAVADHRCGAAVELTARGDRQRVALTDLAVANSIVPTAKGRGAAGVVSIAGAVEVAITGATMRRVYSGDGNFYDDALAAIRVGRGATATIERATIEGPAVGIAADRAKAVFVRDSTVTGVYQGLLAEATTLDAVGNTISGKGQEGQGIGYGEGARGTVAGNDISRFAGPARFVTACGIAIAATAEVEVGAGNRFPAAGSNAANEQDLCDARG